MKMNEVYLLADMDGTILEEECIDEIAVLLGKGRVGALRHKQCRGFEF